MRRPALLERAGALTSRDRMWAAIRRFGTHHTMQFSVAEIMVMSAQREDTVSVYLSGLAKAGFLNDETADCERLRMGRALRVYQLVRDNGVNAPHVDKDGKRTSDNPGRDQMWRAIRILKNDFDRRDLAAAASTEACAVSEEQAKFFCAHLERAGYLHATLKRAHKHVLTRYRFLASRNTGPRAPVIGRDLSVMDGNTGKIMAEATRGKQ